MLEDPSFATEEKRLVNMLKVTMLSGRSTVVAAPDYWNVEVVLRWCRKRLGMGDDGTTMELWNGSDKVPDDADVPCWLGVQPEGEIAEFQLIVRR
eukprot:200762-Amphidinium_carterae.1